MRSEHSTHASYFQDRWKWKSARPTTSRKAGYAPDENCQNEALIRVDTVHVNFSENISIVTDFLGRGGWWLWTNSCSCKSIQSTDIGCNGNLLLSKMAGSNIIVVPNIRYRPGLKKMIEKMAENLWVDPISIIKNQNVFCFCDMELIDVCPLGMYMW